MRTLLAYTFLTLISLAASAQEKDTASVPRTRLWTLSSDYTQEIPVDLDTAFSLFQRYRVTDKYSDFNAYPGNYGQPLYQINFFDREWNPDNYLSQYYMPYMYTPSRIRFVNTHVPFTELRWTNGGGRSKSEQTFRVMHSQNVNRKLNFGMIYDIAYCLGQYSNQKAVDKNFLLHSSYNGDNYTSYATAGINNQETEENGGITSSQFLSQFQPEDVPVNLNEVNNAKSRLKNRHILVVQRFTPGGARDTVNEVPQPQGPVTFSYIGKYEWNRRRYLDSYPVTSFYDTTLISNTSTEDSLTQGLLANTLRVDFAAGRQGRFRLGAGAGVRSELNRYSQVVPGDTLTKPDTIIRKQSSLVLTGKIFNDIGEKFGWTASGDLWFQGSRAGDFMVEGRIFKSFQTSKGLLTWDATGNVASLTPSYWYYSWGSNNFAWQENHDREFRVMAGTSLSWPGRNFSLKFDYAIIDNYIYMGPDAMPAQHNGGLSVASLSLRKEFVFWKMHWDNILLLQQSSNNNVVSLPLVTGRTALFFEHVVRFKSTSGEFNLQLGAEAMAHTLYNAMSYMPATGRYYSQNDTETGNYPFINVFLNLKLKRTRFFIMFDHVLSGELGYDYFLIPDYPLNVRMMRIGFAWSFYD